MSYYAHSRVFTLRGVHRGILYYEPQTVSYRSDRVIKRSHKVSEYR